jgi:hypothetical protein
VKPWLRYRIKVAGTLDDSWSAWFDGLTIMHDADGDTILEGAVRDQAALHGLIAKVRDLGLTLIAVTAVSAFRPPTAHADRGREAGTNE